MDIDDDWRITGQEEFLRGAIFSIQEAPSNYHEHCIFCWHKFMKNCKDIKDCSDWGYCTSENKFWVCEECFNDFKEYYDWTINKKGN